MMKELFEKKREEFGEFDEESRKVDELRLLVQGSRTYDKYVQEFRRAVRGSSDGGDKSKIVNIRVCPFIRDKGDKRKSELCNLQDGSQLYANK